MIRSSSRDNDTSDNNTNNSNKYKNTKFIKSHSRNNSHDLASDFRQKLTHSRTNSRDDQNLNIKYILNHLKKDDDSHRAKKHSRNHSYDQIYTPNNIRFDQDLFKLKKSVNLLKNLEAKVKNSNETSDLKYNHHSRNNSKDLNAKEIKPLVEVPLSASSILRHRRTNSKDLNKMVVSPIDLPSTAVSGGSTIVNCIPNCSSTSSNTVTVSNIISGNNSNTCNSSSNSNNVGVAKHKRNSSQHKIQIENEQESAQLLLTSSSDSHSEDQLM